MNLKNEIHNYWTNRARGYSEYNQQELVDERRLLWGKLLRDLIGEQFPDQKPEHIRVLDIGTGPGFFAILLAEAGYQVTAVDGTEEMLKEARRNAGDLEDRISWVLGDVQELPLKDGQFDVLVSRNVTWNLEKPAEAYREWYRVMREGGVLFNFDANWYSHLFDREKRAAYEEDRRRVQAHQMYDYYVDTDIDKMEEIARQVPLSRKLRPAWDAEIMKGTGYLDIVCREDIWQEVWTDDEKVNYASTPMFLVSGQKKWGALELGGLRAEPGEKTSGFMSIGGGEFSLPATILRGKEPGKTMLITAGVHSGEYVGIQAALELSLRLNIGKVAGTVIIIKVVNRLAFENRKGSVGLTDGKNLNREFPGNPEGTEMERLAYAIASEVQPLADYYIDLHSGDDYEELTQFVYYAGKAEPWVASVSREMAAQVDVPYMVKSGVASGGSYNYAASCRGIPSILIERGGMGAWNNEEVRSTRRDVRNILCHLGIYRGRRDYRRYYPLEVVDVRYQDAGQSGLWYPVKQVGDMFRQGEALGEVRDYEGNILEVSIADYDGVILFQTSSLQVLEDGPMIAYGRIVHEYDERKERIAKYWTKRSEGFLEQRKKELHSHMAERWLKEIQEQLPSGRPLKILDVGCGAGFFTVLLAKEGHCVTGVDLTPDMIKGAKLLAEEEQVSCEFYVMDAEQLDFPDESFDAVVSRNLTWTLPHAEQAYKEWGRVLRDGGVLLNFDANYGMSNFTDYSSLPENHTHKQLGDEMLMECEEIQRQLPISSYSRPAWDLETLSVNGFAEYCIDLGVSSRIYMEKDEFYNPTPVFKLCAKRAADQ